MSAKDSAISTTGIRLSKARGKNAVSAQLGPVPNDLEDPKVFKIEFEKVNKHLQDALDRIHLLEQKLNNMQVDPGTRVVTFPAT